MKKSFLFCLVSGLMLISCNKENQDTVNDDQNTVAYKEPEIPTEDLMSVTTGIETVTYGEFYPGFSSHFFSRIKNRVTVFDENGMTADTNAYFTDELGLDFDNENLFIE